MPKLGAEAQKAASESEGGFAPIPDGRYEVELVSVKESPKPGDSGYKFWSWEFKVVGPSHVGRRLWTNTSLSPDAAFRLREAFDALGYTLDSGTEEMIGDKCVAYVSQQVQEKGKNVGKMQNVIDSLAELSAEQVPGDPWQA